MNISLEQILPADFSNRSRVWIYQSNRLLSMQEALTLEQLFADFVQNWKSHGTPVKGYANLIFGQFIVIMADETQAEVSGCSTDYSVHFIKQLEKQFNIQLFDRQMLAFFIKEKVELLPLSQIEYAIEKGFINEETIYFNNLVYTKQELLENWMIPAGKSWLGKRYFKTETSHS